MGYDTMLGVWVLTLGFNSTLLNRFLRWGFFSIYIIYLDTIFIWYEISISRCNHTLIFKQKSIYHFNSTHLMKNLSNSLEKLIYPYFNEKLGEIDSFKRWRVFLSSVHSLIDKMINYSIITSWWYSCSIN